MAHAQALQEGDMCFPTYRQQGLLLARRHPMSELICQLMSNERDPLKGRQLPGDVLVQARGFSRSRATWPPRSSRPWAGPWPRRSRATPRSPPPGSATAPRRVRLPHRADLRPRVPRAGGAQRGQQPVGHLHLPGHRGGEGTTFAQRGVGCGIASLRVDGNDFLPSTPPRSGRRSARANLGPDADRVGDLPRRRPFHLDDPSATAPPATGSASPGRPDRTAQAATWSPSASGRSATPSAQELEPR